MFSCGYGLHIAYHAFEHHEVVVFTEGGDGGDDGAVDIAEGEVVEEVAEGVDTGFRGQDFGSRRAYALEVCYVVGEGHVEVTG